VSAHAGLVEEIQKQLLASVQRVSTHFREETRPRLARLLEEAALVAVRKATGEDTETAEIAIEASLSNMTLEERNIVQIEARDVALRALVAAVRLIAGAVV
jgi:hypothetical protein